MYLCGMMDYDICYQGKHESGNDKLNVCGFIDADWVGDLDQ
jgi:hypothetical protein